VEGLEWAWLEPDFAHPRVKSLHKYDAPRYLGPELHREAEGCAVTKVVHVQAARRIPDPERETAWLEGAADEQGWPTAIVGDCQLASPDGPEVIARHARHSRFRGVRDMTAAGTLHDPNARTTCAALGLHDGVCELMLSWEHFEAMGQLAGEVPHVTFVLGHAGLPVERTDRYRRQWSAALVGLARAGNVVCKISSLANGADPEWTVDSLRPWVLGCLDAFGPDRCMLGTNWPIDRHYGTYRDLVDAYRVIVSDLSTAEQDAVMWSTAERVYRI
jgi:predicted TIM-barrel fold metal-dependent hydrolase